MATSDDTGKVPTGFTWEEGRGGWWVREEKQKKNKKDNFGKSLNPGVISAQNMQSTQSA